MSENNQQSIVLVGSKPVLAYVVAALMGLADGRDVAIKARGRAICKAIDTVQVIRTKYLSGSLRIKRIEFGSEPRPTLDDKATTKFVSNVMIVLSCSNQRR